MYATGQRIGNYEVVRTLGAGGQGIVYLCRHVTLDRLDAVKVLVRGLAENADARQRFEREAANAARLHHPAIVTVHDAGDLDDGSFYVAMEYIDGPSLDRLIPEGGIGDVQRVLRLIGSVGGVLDAAHAVGLIHRDVKPSNILLAESGSPGERAFLVDFGIAKLLDDSRNVTTNQVMGTYQYMAPERIDGDTGHPASDQYSLACTAYHCLTGEIPFPGTTTGAVIKAHLLTDPPAISTRRPGLPGTCDEVIARAMAKQPGDRYPDCATFAAAMVDAVATAPAIIAVTAPSSATPATDAQAATTHTEAPVTVIPEVALRAAVAPPGGAGVSDLPPEAVETLSPHSAPPDMALTTPRPRPAIFAPAPQPEAAPEDDDELEEAGVTTIRSLNRRQAPTQQPEQQPEPSDEKAGDKPARSRKRRVWSLVGILLLLAAATGAYLYVREPANKVHASGPASASPSASASASGPTSADDQAAAVEAFVVEMKNRQTVPSAVKDLSICQNVPAQVALFSRLLIDRQNEARDLGAIRTDALPGGDSLRATLANAVQESLASAQDYLDYARTVQATNCAASVLATTNPALVLAKNQSITAMHARQAFVTAWTPIANQYGYAVPDQQKL